MKLDYSFCYECKKFIEQASSVLLQDLPDTHCFCDETCLQAFYRSYINYLKEQESLCRQKLRLESEQIADREELSQAVLQEPDEIRQFQGKLGKIVYLFFKELREDKFKIYGVAICLMLRERAPLVLFSTLTRSLKLILEYKRAGKKIPASEDEKMPSETRPVEFSVEADLEESIKRKKSRELAKLMEMKQDGDIQVEEFSLYEQYLGLTLGDPDEVYEFADDDKDGGKLYAYIKAFNRGNRSFYYIAICHLYHVDREREQDVLIPVINFPTLDVKIYQHYQRGEKLAGPLKN